METIPRGAGRTIVQSLNDSKPVTRVVTTRRGKQHDLDINWKNLPRSCSIRRLGPRPTILEVCEGKLNQIYNQRMTGDGSFFPDPPGSQLSYHNAKSVLSFHPVLEFNGNRNDFWLLFDDGDILAKHKSRPLRKPPSISTSKPGFSNTFMETPVGGSVKSKGDDISLRDKEAGKKKTVDKPESDGRKIARTKDSSRRRSNSRDRHRSHSRDRDRRRSRSPIRRRSPVRDRRYADRPSDRRRSRSRDRRRSRSRGRERSKSRDRLRRSGHDRRVSPSRRGSRSMSISSTSSTDSKPGKDSSDILKKFAEKLQEKAKPTSKSLSSIRLSSRLEDTKLRRAEPVTPIVFTLKKAPVKAIPGLPRPEDAAVTEPSKGKTLEPVQVDVKTPATMASAPSRSRFDVPPPLITVPPPVSQPQTLRVTDGVTVACAPTLYKAGKKIPVSSSIISLPPPSEPPSAVNQPPPIVSQPDTPMEALKISAIHHNLAAQALEYANYAQGALEQTSMMHQGFGPMMMQPPGPPPGLPRPGQGIRPGMMGPGMMGYGPGMMGPSDFGPPPMGPPPYGPEGPFMGPHSYGPDGPYMGPPSHGPDGPFMGPPPHGPDGPFMGPPPHGPGGPFMGPPPYGPEGPYMGPPPGGIPSLFGPQDGPTGSTPRPLFPGGPPPGGPGVKKIPSLLDSFPSGTQDGPRTHAQPLFPEGIPQSTSKPNFFKMPIANFEKLKPFANMLRNLQGNLREKPLPIDYTRTNRGIICKIPQESETQSLLVVAPTTRKARKRLVCTVMEVYPTFDLDALIELFESSFHDMPMEDIEDEFERNKKMKAVKSGESKSSLQSEEESDSEVCDSSSVTSAKVVVDEGKHTAVGELGSSKSENGPCIPSLEIPNFEKLEFIAGLIKFLQAKSDLKELISSLEKSPSDEYRIKDGVLCKLKVDSEKQVLAVVVPDDENVRKTIVTALVLKYPDLDVDGLIELFENSFDNMPMEDIEDVFEDELTRKSSLLESVHLDFSTMESISSNGNVVLIGGQGSQECLKPESVLTQSKQTQSITKEPTIDGITVGLMGESDITTGSKPLELSTDDLPMSDVKIVEDIVHDSATLPSGKRELESVELLKKEVKDEMEITPQVNDPTPIQWTTDSVESSTAVDPEKTVNLKDGSTNKLDISEEPRIMEVSNKPSEELNLAAMDTSVSAEENKPEEFLHLPEGQAVLSEDSATVSEPIIIEAEVKTDVHAQDKEDPLTEEVKITNTENVSTVESLPLKEPRDDLNAVAMDSTGMTEENQPCERPQLPEGNEEVPKHLIEQLSVDRITVGLVEDSNSASDCKPHEMSTDPTSTPGAINVEDIINAHPSSAETLKEEMKDEMEIARPGTDSTPIKLITDEAVKTENSGILEEETKPENDVPLTVPDKELVVAEVSATPSENLLATAMDTHVTTEESKPSECILEPEVQAVKLEDSVADVIQKPADDLKAEAMDIGESTEESKPAGSTITQESVGILEGQVNEEMESTHSVSGSTPTESTADIASHLIPGNHVEVGEVGEKPIEDMNTVAMVTSDTTEGIKQIEYPESLGGHTARLDDSLEAAKPLEVVAKIDEPEEPAAEVNMVNPDIASGKPCEDLNTVAVDTNDSTEESKTTSRSVPSECALVPERLTVVSEDLVSATKAISEVGSETCHLTPVKEEPIAPVEIVNSKITSEKPSDNVSLVAMDTSDSTEEIKPRVSPEVTERLAVVSEDLVGAAESIGKMDCKTCDFIPVKEESIVNSVITSEKPSDDLSSVAMDTSDSTEESKPEVSREVPERLAVVSDPVDATKSSSKMDSKTHDLTTLKEEPIASVKIVNSEITSERSDDLSTVAMDTSDLTDSSECPQAKKVEVSEDQVLKEQVVVSKDSIEETKSVTEVAATTKELPQRKEEPTVQIVEPEVVSKVDIPQKVEVPTQAKPVKFKSTYALIKSMDFGEPKVAYVEPSILSIVNYDKLTFFASRLIEIQKCSDIASITTKIAFVRFDHSDPFVMKNGLLCKRKDLEKNEVFIYLVKSTAVYREIVSALTEQYPDLEFNEFMSLIDSSFCYITPDEIKTISEALDKKATVMKYPSFIERCKLVNEDMISNMLEQLRAMQKADSAIAHRYKRLTINNFVDDSYIVKLDLVCQFNGTLDFKVCLPKSQPDQIAIIYIVHEANHKKNLIELVELLRATFDGVNLSLIEQARRLCSTCHSPATARASSMIKACEQKCSALKSLPPEVIFKIRQVQMASSVYKAQIELLTKGQARQGSRYIIDTSLLCKAMTQGTKEVYRVVVSPSSLKEVVSLLHTTFHRKTLREFVPFVNEFLAVTEAVCKAVIEECNICGSSKAPKKLNELPKIPLLKTSHDSAGVSTTEVPNLPKKETKLSGIDKPKRTEVEKAESKRRDSKEASKSSRDSSKRESSKDTYKKESSKERARSPRRESKESTKDVRNRDTKASTKDPKRESSKESTKDPKRESSKESTKDPKRTSLKESPKDPKRESSKVSNSSQKDSTKGSMKEVPKNESSHESKAEPENVAQRPSEPHQTPRGNKVRRAVLKDIKTNERIWGRDFGERIKYILRLVPDKVLTDTIDRQKSCPVLMDIRKGLERSKMVRDPEDFICGDILFMQNSKKKLKVAVKSIKHINYFLITQMHADNHDWTVNKIQGTISIVFDVNPSKDEVEAMINWFCTKCQKPGSSKNKKIYSSLDERLEDFYRSLRSNEKRPKESEVKAEEPKEPRDPISKKFGEDLQVLEKIWGSDFEQKITAAIKPIPLSLQKAIIDRQRECYDLADLIESLESQAPVKDARHVLCGGILFVVKSKKKMMMIKIHVKPIKKINYLLITQLHAAFHDWTVNRIQTTIGISFDVSPSREEVAVTIEWFCTKCKAPDANSKKWANLDDQLKEFYNTVSPALLEKTSKEEDDEDDSVDLTQEIPVTDVRLVLAKLPSSVVSKIQIAQMGSNVLKTQIELLENKDGPTKGKGYCLVMSLLCKLVDHDGKLVWRVMIPADTLNDLVVELHTVHYHDMLQDEFFEFINSFTTVPANLVTELFATCATCLATIRRVPTLCERGINEDLVRKTLASIAEMLDIIIKWQTENASIAKIREGVNRGRKDDIANFIMYKDILFKCKSKGTKQIRPKIAVSLLPNALDEVIKSTHAFYHSSNQNQLMNLINVTFDVTVSKNVLTSKIPELCKICGKKSDGAGSGDKDVDEVRGGKSDGAGSGDKVVDDSEKEPEIKTEGEEPTPLGVLLLGRLCDQVIEESSNSSRALDSPVPDLNDTKPVVRQIAKIVLKRCQYDPNLVQSEDGAAPKRKAGAKKPPAGRAGKAKSTKTKESDDESANTDLDSDSNLPKRKFVVYSSESEIDDEPKTKKRKATTAVTKARKKPRK